MKNLAIIAALLVCAGFVGITWVSYQHDVEFEVPPGFTVEQLLDDERSGGPVALTFDSDGHLVVAKEFDYIVRFIDEDNDGEYEVEQLITDQGILFDGPDLLVVGSGPQGVGLYRVPDADGDGLGDEVILVELATGRVSDHGPHDPFFGPDGFVYWTHGNFSNIYPDPAPLSPVRSYAQAAILEREDPRGFGSRFAGGPGGIFLRKDLAVHALPAEGRGGQGRGGFGPGGFGSGAAPSEDWELFSNGFRNQYDGVFNLMGEMFTFDSDMEWDRDLPWYRETRSVHVVPGGDYGYRENTAKHPAYYFDDLPPMEETGRGSPTGMAVLQTYNYPAEYWDAVLQADWSRGRVLMGKLTKNGATYTQESSNFIFATPLNVTDLEVGPDGNLYFALGGRSTDGGLYRVVYSGADAMGQPEATTPLDRVLTMMQPRSSYSRQMARETRQEIGDAAWQQGLTAVARDPEASPARRVRALELLQVFGPGLDANTLIPLASDGSWEVRATVAYYLGMKAGRAAGDARQTLAALLGDQDAFVQRRAAEALLRTGLHPAVNAPVSAVEDVFPLLASPDRFVRYAGRNLLRQINPNHWKEAALKLDSYPEAPEALMAYLQNITSPDIWDITRFVNRELELLRNNPLDSELLDLVRVIQRTILESYGVTDFRADSSIAGIFQEKRDPDAPRGGGGRFGGDQVFAYEEIGKLLLERFPTADKNLSREIARTTGALNTPGAVSAIAAELGNPDNDREQQIFYADVLSFMDTGWDETSVDQMATWIERVYVEKWKGGASFSGAIGYIGDDFLAHIPAEFREDASSRIDAAKPEVVASQGGGGFRGPTNISDAEIEESLIFNPNILQADAAAGVWAYEKALCSTCHTFGPIGIEYGPDLTTINQRFSRTDLVRSITRPSEVVSDLWQVTQITQTDGQIIAGTIYSENAQRVVIQIPGGGQVVVPASQIESRTVSEVSSMPEGLLHLLGGGERRDLLKLLEEGPSAIPDSALARING